MCTKKELLTYLKTNIEPRLPRTPAASRDMMSLINAINQGHKTNLDIMSPVSHFLSFDPEMEKKFYSFINI